MTPIFPRRSPPRWAPTAAAWPSPEATACFVWSASEGEELRFPPGSPTRPTAVAFSRDAALAAVGFESGVVAVWGPGDPSPLLLAVDGPDVQALAFSPDARLLAATEATGATTFLDLAAARPLMTLDGPPSPASELRFSPDGLHLRRLAHDDATARVIDWSAAPPDPSAPDHAF